MERTQHTLVERVGAHPDAARALVLLAVLLAAMAVLTVVFGVTRPGPGYDFVGDPGAVLGF